MGLDTGLAAALMPLRMWLLRCAVRTSLLKSLLDEVTAWEGVVATACASGIGGTCADPPGLGGAWHGLAGFAGGAGPTPR